jgi:hypothetical protein
MTAGAKLDLLWTAVYIRLIGSANRDVEGDGIFAGYRIDVSLTVIMDLILVRSPKAVRYGAGRENICRDTNLHTIFCRREGCCYRTVAIVNETIQIVRDNVIAVYRNARAAISSRRD